MSGRKYINLVEISLVALELRKAEFGNFSVPVNNTLVCSMPFLFSWPLAHYCVLIFYVRTVWLCVVDTGVYISDFCYYMVIFL